MGKLINGINGPFIGKVGAIIGSHRKGKAYVKGTYKRRTKNISAKEQLNRDKFGVAQAWLRPLVGYVRTGFKNYSETSEGFVVAKSYLLREAMVLEEGVWRVLPEKVKVSSGKLPLPQGITVTQTSVGEFLFSWDHKRKGNEHPYDLAMPMAYNVERGFAMFFDTGAFRATGSFSLAVDKVRPGTYQLYLAFSAADRLSQSDSVYLGELAVVPVP